MTSEDMERAIAFLRKTQAKTSVRIAVTSETVNRLAETVERDRRENRQRRAAKRRENRKQSAESRAHSEVSWQRTREAINNLIIANEATRALTEQVAKLAISTSQRVTALETARGD
jgi:hypothetical protein